MRWLAPGPVGISLSGCDFGTSGVGVFAREVVPRVVSGLLARGVTSQVIGSKREREGVGVQHLSALRTSPRLDAPGLNALFSLVGLPIAAELLRYRAIYLPAANRRVVVPLGTPVVGTVHDLAQFHVDNKYGLAREIYIKRVLTPILRRFDRVIAVSEATARDIEQFAGVSRSKIRVVYNGVSLARPSAEKCYRDRPFMLYPARLELPGKNHLRVLEAFARCDACKDHELVLTGKDWGAEARIRRHAEKLGIQDRLDIQGFVSKNDLSRLMTNASVVIVAGLFEGFGLQAAEALSLGRPVACSSTGSLPEVVGDLGVVFDPTDVDSMTEAFDKAVSDADLRTRCEKQGPVWVEKFSWDRCAEQTTKIIQEVLA